MAKARSLSPTEAAGRVPACLARLIELRLNEIEAHTAGVYEGSVDAVHDMRVSCRRLQAVFKAFNGYFQKKKVKKFRRVLRALISALGAVREYDVLVGHIRSAVQPTTVLQRTALSLLVSRYSLLRFQAHRKLLPALQSFGDANGVPAFRTGLRKIFNSKADAEVSFASLLRQTVPEKFAAFFSASGMVANHPRRRDALHRLRIKGKPLRYVMELSEPCFSPAYRQCYKEIKSMIELLGDIHDNDVTLATLQSYLQEIRYVNAPECTVDSIRIQTGFLRNAITSLRAKRAAQFGAMSSAFEGWGKKRFDRLLVAAMNAGKVPARQGARAARP
jgi:CHAD domain-containing protein